MLLMTILNSFKFVIFNWNYNNIGGSDYRNCSHSSEALGHGWAARSILNFLTKPIAWSVVFAIPRIALYTSCTVFLVAKLKMFWKREGRPDLWAQFLVLGPVSEILVWEKTWSELNDLNSTLHWFCLVLIKKDFSGRYIAVLKIYCYLEILALF